MLLQHAHARRPAVVTLAAHSKLIPAAAAVAAD